MNREKILLKNTLILAFGTFFPKFSNIITLPIITGYLSKAEYGTFDLINTLVILLLPIFTLELPSATFRFLIECREDEEEKKSTISTLFTFVITVSFLALIMLFFVLRQLETKIRLVMCIYLFVDMLLISLQQIARGFSNNKAYSVSASIVSIGNLLFVIVFVYFLRYSLLGVILAIMVSTLCGVIYLTIELKIWKTFDLKLFSNAKLIEMLKYSWPMIPNTLSNWVVSLSDRLVITGFLGVEMNAVYAVANKFPSVFASVQGTFVMAWQENASISAKDDDIENYYSKMFDGVIRMLFGTIAMLIVLTPFLFSVLIKGDYGVAYKQIQILYVAMFFSAIASFLGGIFVAAKETKSIGITTVFAAIINLVVNIIFIRYIGIWAASISTLISYMLLAIYRMVKIRRIVYMQYDLKNIVKIILMLIFICLVNTQNSFFWNELNIVFAASMAVIINKKILNTIVCKFKRREK